VLPKLLKANINVKKRDKSWHSFNVNHNHNFVNSFHFIELSMNLWFIYLKVIYIFISLFTQIYLTSSYHYYVIIMSFSLEMSLIIITISSIIIVCHTFNVLISIWVRAHNFITTTLTYLNNYSLTPLFHTQFKSNICVS